MAQSTVKLIVDAQNAIAPLKRVNEQTKNLNKNSNTLKNRLEQNSRNFTKFGNNAKKATSGVSSLTKTVRNLFAAFAVIQAAKFVFIKTAELETQRKSLEVLTGSLEKTNEIIQELQDFGAVTPFTSSELIEQTKRLKAFGFETEELVDTTKRLSEVAGATGADLTGIATAFGQIRAKGKLQQEENLQLLERGVDITTELKRITGLQGDAFEKAQRQGKIGADLVNQALINLTNEGGAFFGGATAQATTLNGKLSTLQDSIETLARTIGTELEDEIKAVLDLSIAAVKEISSFIESIGLVNKLGKKTAIEIETKARDEATKELFGKGKKFGRFEGIINPQARKEFQELFDLKKKELITSALTLKNSEKQTEEEKKRQKLVKDAKDKAEKIKNDSKETVTAIESQVTVSELFNKSLGETSFFVNNLSLGSNKFADALINVKSEADRLKETFMEIGQGIEQGIVSNLTDAVMGTQTLAQAAVNVLNQLKRKLVEVAIQRAVSGIGNFIGGALGGIFGGGGGSTNQFIGRASADAFRANGGPVSAGGAFVVGEKGPELLQMGSRGGNIIPNNQLGGSTTNIVNVSVDASGSAVSGSTPDAQELGNLIGAAIQERLIKEKRSGGLLSR